MALCLKYFVLLNSNYEPTPSTMQGYPPNNLPCGNTCSLVELRKTPYTTPNGMHQCFFPSGQRYFYLVTRKGDIVPNSMQARLTFPTDLNSCRWIEYKRYCQN